MNTRISKTQFKNVVKNLTQFIFLIDHDLKSAYTCILILIHFNTAIAKNKKVCEETVKLYVVCLFYSKLF